MTESDLPRSGKRKGARVIGEAVGPRRTIEASAIPAAGVDLDVRRASSDKRVQKEPRVKYAVLTNPKMGSALGYAIISKPVDPWSAQLVATRSDDDAKLRSRGDDDHRYRSRYRTLLDELGAPKAGAVDPIADSRALRHAAKVGKTTWSQEPARIQSVAEIGARVRAARPAMSLTQGQFADLAGVGRRFLVELEKGKATLEIGLVLKACKAAGLGLAILP